MWRRRWQRSGISCVQLLRRSQPCGNWSGIPYRFPPCHSAIQRIKIDRSQIHRGCSPKSHHICTPSRWHWHLTGISRRSTVFVVDRLRPLFGSSSRIMSFDSGVDLAKSALRLQFSLSWRCKMLLYDLWGNTGWWWRWWTRRRNCQTHFRW